MGVIPGWRENRGSGDRPQRQTACPWFLALILWAMAVPAAMADYYEFSTFDHQKAYDYLDKVEAAVGTEAFEEVPYEQAFSVALPLGRIDKWYLTPQSFMSHVTRTQIARKRFYRERPLTDDEVKSDLLAYRIRYEISESADWMEQVARRFEPVTAGAKTADEAAKAILSWMSGNLELTDKQLGYKLPLRGDREPVMVLKEKKGSEIDLAICGVAALRASGVAARIVYAPALRGEMGGKVWLEYLGEDRGWRPWVPSFGKAADHRVEIRKRFGDRIALVMTRPEAPREITDDYVETTGLTFETDGQEVQISLMVFGKQGLMPARGNEVDEMKDERSVRVGRGLVIAAASFGNRSFALLPVEIPATASHFTIHAERGSLRAGEIRTIESKPPTNP